MQIAVFGINLEHSQIPISEKLLPKIKSFLPHFDIVPLITCNRFEVYINTSQKNFLRRVFYDFLEKDFNQNLLERSYLYFSYDCFYHLSKTTAGLDSAILGESEIQHQVKIAYLGAAKQKLPFCLHFLFQKALKIGKQIRTHFLFQSSCSKLTTFIWDEIQQVYKNPSILFVGQSKINNGIKTFFLRKKVNNITVSTRYPERNDLSFLPVDQLHRWVDYDVIICATKMNEKCIFPMMIKKKIFLFDLSVPSVVDPKIAENKNVVFWPLHKINAYFSKQRKYHTESIQECLKEIEKQVTSQKDIFKRKERNRLIFQKEAS